MRENLQTAEAEDNQRNYVKTLTPELSVKDTEETQWYSSRFNNSTIAYAYNLIIRNIKFWLSIRNTKFLLLRYISNINYNFSNWTTSQLQYRNLQVNFSHYNNTIHQTFRLCSSASVWYSWDSLYVDTACTLDAYYCISWAKREREREREKGERVYRPLPQAKLSSKARLAELTWEMKRHGWIRASRLATTSVNWFVTASRVNDLRRTSTCRPSWEQVPHENSNDVENFVIAQADNLSIRFCYTYCYIHYQTLGRTLQNFRFSRILWLWSKFSNFQSSTFAKEIINFLGFEIWKISFIKELF